MFPNKIAIYIGLVVAIIGAVGFFSYKAGGDAVRADAAKAVALATHEANKKQKEIIKWKVKREIVFRDRVQKIKVAADPSGCLDLDLRSVGLASLLNNSGQ